MQGIIRNTLFMILKFIDQHSITFLILISLPQ